MNTFADTSFLCALLYWQANSPRAGEVMDRLAEPLAISTLVEFEFIQGVRFEVFLHAADHTRGYDETRALGVLAAYELACEEGKIAAVRWDWEDVRRHALRISGNHTARIGCRALDILHVAAALSLGVREFLTFDGVQHALAEAEGLVVPL